MVVLTHYRKGCLCPQFSFSLPIRLWYPQCPETESLETYSVVVVLKVVVRPTCTEALRRRPLTYKDLGPRYPFVFKGTVKGKRGVAGEGVNT